MTEKSIAKQLNIDENDEKQVVMLKLIEALHEISEKKAEEALKNVR